MGDIVISRSELVGNTKLKSSVVNAIARSNALNLTGNINYNVYGFKDGIGFESVTKKFVDNFLLRVLVPDYNMKNGKNIFIGTHNKSIREMLNAFDLEKCIVKAVVFTKLKYDPPADILDRMPFRT